MSTSSSANQTGATSWSGPRALIGAAVGAAVGGIAGSLGLGNKGKKYKKRAQAVQKEREGNAQEADYLQLIRQARMARSGSLAAATTYGLATSSLSSSALSSIGSQSQYSVQYTANDQRLVELYNKYMKKAGSYAKAAQTTLTAVQLTSMALGAGAAFSSAGAAAISAVNAGTTVGATEITPAMVEGFASYTPEAINALYSSTYAKTLQSNILNLGLWNSVASPIYQGINQYNQI